MKFILFFFLIPFFSYSQSAIEIGGRVGKFNHGVNVRIIKYENNNPSSIDLFLGYSKLNSDGFVGKGMYDKQWNIRRNRRQTELYVLSQLGGHIGFYKPGNYKLINHNQGISKYYDKPTFNLGIDAGVGLDWISGDYPISIAFIMNPWYDLINRGPEWIDYWSITLRYRFVGR